MPWDTGGTEPGLMTSSTPGGPPSSYHGQDKQKQTERDSGHILKQTKEKKNNPNSHPKQDARLNNVCCNSVCIIERRVYKAILLILK